MEKITAYKANNGRLFETEEKCLAYENKLSQYPKVKKTTKRAEDSYITNENGHGEYVSTDIVKHVIETWEKPSSQKKTNFFYVVGGKYKFIDLHGRHGVSLMNGGTNLFKAYDTSTDWYLGARHFAEIILNGNELTDNLVKDEIEKINSFNKIKLTYEIIQPNIKWKIDNPQWRNGSVAPYTFTMEKMTD